MIGLDLMILFVVVLFARFLFFEKNKFGILDRTIPSTFFHTFSSFSVLP